ncbi:DUF5615 family PIN-like protein [Niabella insulamsoli]|uniref:DUF5615 family PIN-like protein n=1 Tax=Niabella insulamsoli TaxID=3144874 RepID=UPI0031FD81B9
MTNENFPRSAILSLRRAGYIVKSIQEDHQGIKDEEVLRIANELGYVIQTFDRDYGELIFKYAEKNPPAAVFFREKGAMPDAAATVLLKLLTEQRVKISGAFTVIDSNNIRQRFYKTPNA